jgi:hypothetical protein
MLTVVGFVFFALSTCQDSNPLNAAQFMALMNIYSASGESRKKTQTANKQTTKKKKKKKKKNIFFFSKSVCRLFGNAMSTICQHRRLPTTGIRSPGLQERQRGEAQHVSHNLRVNRR